MCWNGQSVATMLTIRSSGPNINLCRGARRPMPDAAAERARPPEMVQLNSGDPVEVRHLLKRFYQPITIRTPDGPDDFELDVHVIRLGPLTVGEFSFRSPVTLMVADLDGYHVMA